MTPAMQVLMRQMEALWDRFCAEVFERSDVTASAGALASDVEVREIPTMAGGAGREEVLSYLEGTLVPHLPADLTRARRSRTVDTRRLVDEVEVTFTHDRELPWLLPGVPGTGRRVTVLAVSIVGIRQNRIHTLRTLWDQAGLRAALRPSEGPG